MKTIDINAREWFDKVNGNSYFAGTVTVDFGTPEEQTFNMPFQYGYGDQYKQKAGAVLDKAGLLPDVERYQSGCIQPLWSYCRDRGIILRSHIQTGCRKRDLK